MQLHPATSAAVDIPAVASEFRFRESPSCLVVIRRKIIPRDRHANTAVSRDKNRVIRRVT